MRRSWGSDLVTDKTSSTGATTLSNPIKPSSMMIRFGQRERFFSIAVIIEVGSSI
jgi:hypothetical protein